MAVTVYNLTNSPLVLPEPIGDIIGPIGSAHYAYIEYDVVINDARIASLVTKGVLRIESDDDVKRPSNAVTVAKSGGDFTSIQEAIDSIIDASQTNPYVVQVYPGVYDEQLTMKAFVSVDGVADNRLASSTVTLTASGTAVTWPDGALFASISHMTFLVDNAPNPTDRLFLVGAAQIVGVTDCFCFFQNPVQSATAIEITGATQFALRDVTLFGSFGPLAGSNPRRYVHLNGDGATVAFQHCGSEVTLDDPDDDFYFIDDDPAVSGGGAQIWDSGLQLAVLDAAYAGSATLIRLRGGMSALARDSTFSVNSANAVPGTGRIFYLDNGGGGVRPNHFGCHYSVSQDFAAQVLAEILAGSEANLIDATFDDSNTLTMLVGAGTLSFSGADSNWYGIRTNLPAQFEHDTFEAQGTSFRLPNLKAGINQGAAGAGPGELWVDTSVPDHPIKRGV